MSEDVATAAAAIHDVYRYNCVGGALHMVLDHEDVSDESLRWSEGQIGQHWSDEEPNAALLQAAERRCLAALWPLTVADRLKALAMELDNPTTESVLSEPRCTCTHRRSEHYGPCQRPGCGCEIFQEPTT